jgi:hypothetical protein
MNKRLETTLEWTPVALAVAAALFWSLWTLLLWSRWHPHMPWRDLFVILDQLRPLLEGEGGWRAWFSLVEPHYAAHRIALPRLLVALDVTIFHGRNHLLYAVAFAAMLTILGLWAAMARDCLRGRLALWLFACGLFATSLFAPAHLWNLVNPVNTSWHLSMALAALGFAVLVRKDGPPGTPDWLLAYLLATLSAFTTFAGVIAWLLLPAAALSGDRRVLLLTAAASLGLTLLYCLGITSDAAIAAAWNAGDPGIAEQLRRTGEAALAANDLGRITRRAALLLTWPLSAGHPALAGLMLVGSIIPLALGWWYWLRSELRGSERLHCWARLCLLLATLSLGVALAVQLGRLIEQPNHPHGPSYERYNTLVAIYWGAVAGLVVAWLARRPPIARSAGMAALIAVLYALMVPGGDYLQQEISSLQAAARLYAQGEMPELRQQTDARLLRFRPEYVYSFDRFFHDRELAYARSIPTPAAPREAGTCPPRRLQLSRLPASRDGIAALRAEVTGVRHLLTREILLTVDGSLLARLYPVHEGVARPLDLVRRRGNAWVGELLESRLPPGELLVTLVGLGGARFSCMLPAGTARQSTAFDPGGTAGDVPVR